MALRLLERLMLLVRVMRGCGPVVGLELRIISRQRRTYALRMGYVVILAVVTAAVWISASGQLGGVSSMHLVAALPRVAADAVWQVLLFLMLGGPMGAVITMTGAFSVELQAGGFSALRSTPLSFGHIVFGRFVGRMAQLTVLLLAALPALALIRGFGGVPWRFVLVGMAVVLGATCCAGAAALHNAARLGTGWAAVRQSWRWAALFSIPGLWWLISCRNATHYGGWWIPVVMYACGLPLTLARAVGALRYHARHKLDRDPDLQPRLARDPYVYLPPVPEEPGGVLEPVRTTYADLVDDDFSRSEPIDGSPIVWRALRNRKLRWTKGGVASLALLCVVLFVKLSFDAAQGEYGAICVLAMVGLFVLFAASALMSSSAISREREARCLAMLLTTPMSARDILMDKVRVILRRISLLLVLPAGFITLFSLFGMIHVVGAICLMLMGAAALAFVIGLGLCVSSACSRTSTARALTLGILAFAWGLVPRLAGGVLQLDPVASPAQGPWWAGCQWLRPFEATFELARLSLANAPLTGLPLHKNPGTFVPALLGAVTMAALYASAGMLLVWRAMRQIRRNPA